jgi:hypothetical protein
VAVVGGGEPIAVEAEQKIPAVVEIGEDAGSDADLLLLQQLLEVAERGFPDLSQRGAVISASHRDEV